ncbi:MAG: agmatinase [Desulfovibrionaceae bacterium]|nr:agmatinase [Desulfovibrionaceae bacterium]
MVDDNISFLASEYDPASKEDALFHIFPVPLEKSVSYGSGTRLGPHAILSASEQLEAHENFQRPGLNGIYTAPMRDCSSDIQTILDAVAADVANTILAKKYPILLGGEHTVTLGALRAFADTKICSKPGLVQFDAHADLRPEYEGNPYSHASVMYRAVADLGFQLVQFGIREYSLDEITYQKKFNVLAHTANDLADFGWPEPILPADFPDDIYITFDVDGFDASLMPATGTPSPGGFFWQEVRQILTKLSRIRRIVGFDVVELAPMPALASCDFTAAKLVHLLMSLIVSSR